MINEHDILLAVLAKYQNAAKWKGALFGHIKSVSNSHVGAVGQEFVAELCDRYGLKFEFPVGREGKRTLNAPWDIRIEGVSFEIKTATEDTSGSFQFNHVRHHREYQALLCIGIAPDEVVFDAWTKADIATGKAGNLASMDKGSSATFKLTKRRKVMRNIQEFHQHIRGFTAAM